jgi:hypothetical protein
MSVKSNALLLAGAAVAVAGFAARAADLAAASTNAVPVQGVGPRIEFAAPYFDFDRVQSGKLVSHDFIFTNTGDQALEISDVQSSCGCAAATNWDMRIEPGKAGTIPVLFNSGGMAGPVEKNLWVICNDPVHPNVRLGFAATIWKFIDTIPTVATFTFGPDFQTNETRVIRLVSNLPEPVTLSAPLCTNGSFKAELKTVQKGKEFELLVTVVPPLGPGSLIVPITMKSSAPEMPVVTATAYAMVQPALTLMPPRIRLPSTPLAEAEQFVVKIRNNGTQPVVLSEPGINAKGASVQLREEQPGRLFELTVAFPAGFRSPAGQPVEAHVNSNHQQSPVIKVPVVQLETSATD